MKTGVMASMALLAAVAPLAAQEAPDTIRLREVVVTAARLPTPLATAPGTATVLKGEDLRERGIPTVADALRSVPGVTVARSGGPGALTSVFFRGGESDYVQVLVDGVQVNAPGGAFDWSHLRAEDIERIEIVRGPASVLYGSDAVSGVVQIFTRAGGAPRTEAGVKLGRGERTPEGAGGAFHTATADATANGRVLLGADTGGELRYGISAVRDKSTGLYPEHSGYDNTTASARVHLLAGRGDAALTARSVLHEYHYPTSGSGMVIGRDQFATGDAVSLGFDAGHRPIAGMEIRVAAALHRTDTRTDIPSDTTHDDAYHDTARQTRRTLDARLNADLPLGTILTLGAEREWQAARTAYESVSAFGTFQGESDEDRTNTGYYAQLHGTPARALGVTIGGRVDDNEKFGTFGTGRLAVSWSPTPLARVHGAAGTAFKEPTFYENFATGFARGNPDLEPEQARSWEAGAELSALEGRVSAGATWFHQQFRNLIQYTYTTPDPDAPNYYNIGAARARGLEITGTAELPRARLTASWTFTSSRVTDEGFGDDPSFAQDQRLLRRPVHQASAGIAAPLGERVRALLDVRYVGSRDDLDFTDPDAWSGRRVVLPSYARLDAGLTWAVRPGNRPDIDVSLHIDNALDARYEEIFNFPAPGRVLRLGLRAGI